MFRVFTVLRSAYPRYGLIKFFEELEESFAANWSMNLTIAGIITKLS